MIFHNFLGAEKEVNQSPEFTSAVKVILFSVFCTQKAVWLFLQFPRKSMGIG